MLATGQNTQPAWNTGANELRSFCSACAGAFPCAPGHVCCQWGVPQACPASAEQLLGSCGAAAEQGSRVQFSTPRRPDGRACLTGLGPWRARTSSTPVHTKKRERYAGKSVNWPASVFSAACSTTDDRVNALAWCLPAKLPPPGRLAAVRSVQSRPLLHSTLKGTELRTAQHATHAAAAAPPVIRASGRTRRSVGAAPICVSCPAPGIQAWATVESYKSTHSKGWSKGGCFASASGAHQCAEAVEEKGAVQSQADDAETRSALKVYPAHQARRLQERLHPDTADVRTSSARLSNK
jgi:hypothetical protein